MNKAKLTSLVIERFKSFNNCTEIRLAPLTVILGRNNSGKSSLIQALLLLKQTLSDPRSDVMLKLDGIVDAFNLRELTFGWPESFSVTQGPTIRLEWECEVDIDQAFANASNPDRDNLAKHSGLEYLKTLRGKKKLTTTLLLNTEEADGVARLSRLEITSLYNKKPLTSITVEARDTKWVCYWKEHHANQITAEFDHFIPYLRIDRSRVGPRDRQRAWHNAYLILFAQPLEALKRLLLEFHYLGSSRQPPSSLFKPATTPPGEIGINGEWAAQLLHRRQRDRVHFLPPFQVEDDASITPLETVHNLPLVDAVNQVMQGLSVNAPLRIKEIEQIGFQLMFGEASLVHVGRGLNSLLPVVELGLFADPLGFSGNGSDMSLEQYQKRCPSFSHIALEEPEAHLHPKVASRLAHWLVSLAMANRRLIVETHSDHLVRRLRGLVARAGQNTALERWLLDNVVILSVEQAEDGSSVVTTSRLTPEGGLGETWPVDFMDEATDEESAIYYAKLDKTPVQAEEYGGYRIDDGEEPEPDEEP